MYSVLHETDDATSVEFSLWGTFLPGGRKQLVTAGAKCLKFYRLNPLCKSDKASISQMRLECILTYTTMCPIRGMAIIRLKEYPDTDALALAFDDAKLSLVNINPQTLALNTLSLHSIEDEFLREGYSKTSPPEICADPESRCCTLTVYGRHLAIIPFIREAQINSSEGYGARQILLQSYTVKLRSFDERLENVQDMCFLNGYYEPTLLFLYEPIQTTSGRACVRYDTMCILGVSLNLKDRVHAIVWNFTGLPMTVNRCLPLLQPIGGICLFGANEIIYLNQSVPPRGISLNSCAEEYSRFPLNENQQNLRITLDGCVVQALKTVPNDILIVSREGNLYILSLETDQANIVRNMHLKKAYETSIPSSLTVCYSNLIFVGSRLGDSQLLHFNYEQRKRSDDLNAAFYSNHSKILFDEDDVYLYGEDFCRSFVMEESLLQITRIYKFELIDTLPNIGPCKWLRTCSANYISDVFQKKPRDVYFDMMTASGHAKDSSLCFFQRTIRPQIITSTFLEDSQKIWTIGKRRDGTHKYLLISRERSSMALELANDMIELEMPLFSQTESTIAACDLADGAIAIQITPTSIIIVANGQQLVSIAVDSNFPVVSASIEDPFIVLLTLNGHFFLYQLSTNPQIQLERVPILEQLKHEKSPITSISIYKDLSGLMQFSTEESNTDDRTNRQKSFGIDSRLFARTMSLDQPTIKSEPMHTEQMDTDEFEAYLYGATEKQRKRSEHHNDRNQSDPNELNGDFHHEKMAPVKSSYWLFIARENGNLYIFTLPKLRLVYMVRKFSQAHDVLYNDAQSAIDEQRPQQNAIMNAPMIIPQPVESLSSEVAAKPEEIIVELSVCGIGINESRPILTALIDDMVIFYELFPYDEKIPGYLAVRFRRLACTVIVRENRFLGQNGRAPVEATREGGERHRQIIHPFRSIGQFKNGIFIAGSYPSILVLERGEHRLHPMTIDGPIIAFAQFHNVNCKDGFLYLTKDHLMRVAMFNPDFNYDCSYPCKKIHIGKTIHQAVFMLQPDLVALCVSEKIPNKTVCTVVNEERQVETHERDENFILPTIDSYTLKLFSTEDWKFIPNSDFVLEEFEAVTCCEEVLLNSESTVSGVKNYLAMGTALNYGEEVFVRGRVVLFELIEVVPEEGMPTTRHRLKSIYDKEQKGPVTSICAINGFLLTGMGQKIFIWQFRDNNLHGVSFLDLHFYVHLMISFREFALACDLYRSLSLIRYQEEFKALSLVSRDLRPTAPAPMTANFIVDQKQLGFLLTDELANITLFNFQPETKESIGGERLIIRAALNIGSLINSTVRVIGHTSECFIDSEHQRDTHTCYFATLGGSFGFVRPLSEKVFRRLHMLQQMMNMHVPQPAGLNPRGARSARPQKTGTNQQISAAKNIVDGLLITQYLHLNTQEKTDLARKLGTSRYQILDDLTELLRTTTHY